MEQPQRISHNLVQGSPEWDQFRLEHDGASEAAAALATKGSKTTRDELLRLKKTGIAKDFSDFVRRKFEDGHEAEAAARPIVEEIIGEPLYPQTYSYGRLSASCDGLTASDQIAFEHKIWNARKAEIVAAGEVPEEDADQCQQVMHVTGAEKLIYVVSDGTRENMVYVWVQPDPERVKRIIAGWDLFHKDLEDYVPVEVIPAAVARPTLDLPVPVIEASGAIAVFSNLTEFGAMLDAFIKGLPEKPDSDQDFADCKAAVAKLKAAEEALDAGEARAIAQLSEIDAMRREKKLYFDLSRNTRLALEKLVDAREKAIKVEVVQEGKDKLAAHIAAINKRLRGVQMPPIAADFAAAIKGKKTIKGLRDGVAELLTAKRLEADEIAGKIQDNLQQLEAVADYAFLFNDRAAIVMKAADDLALLIKSRIQDHKAAEEARAAAERERIRAEEAARVQAEKDAEDRLIVSIWANARRIEADTVPHIDKAIARFEAAAGEFAHDPRTRVVTAISEARHEMQEKLVAAKAKAQQEEAERQRRAADEAAANIERDRAAEKLRTERGTGTVVEVPPGTTITLPSAAVTTAIDPRKVSAKPAKMSRPTDADIIMILTDYYRVHEFTVIAWLLDMDLKAASDAAAKEFAA